MIEKPTSTMRLRHLPPLGTLDQASRPVSRPMRVPSMRTVVSGGRQIGGKGEVAEAHHGEPVGHDKSLNLRLDQDAERQEVGGAEHRVDVRRAVQQLDQPLAAAAQRGRRRNQADWGHPCPPWRESRHCGAARRASSPVQQRRRPGGPLRAR